MKQFGLMEMRLQGHDRVREIKLWEVIKEEQLKKGDFDINGYYYEEGGSVTGSGSFSFDLKNNCIDFHEGSNLISLSSLPPNGGLSDIPECIDGIIGEGIGAVYLDGSWIGSLTELSCDDGYWMKNSCDDFEWCYSGVECSNPEYSLHAGANLISYPLSECGSIDEVLSDDVEECDMHAKTHLDEGDYEDHALWKAAELEGKNPRDAFGEWEWKRMERDAKNLEEDRRKILALEGCIFRLTD